jgi:signal transduction histidine kinase
MTHLFLGDLAPGPEAGPDPSSTPPTVDAAVAVVPDLLPGAETTIPETTFAGRGADLLAPFAPAIMAVRWATTGVSLALASPALLSGDSALGFWMALILANTVVRTFRPLRYTASIRSLLALVAEIGVHVLAVIATGYWGSPAVLVLINAVIIAGFARGFGFALRVGAASTLAVTMPGIGSPEWASHGPAVSAQWATLIALSGIVAGYSRRISGEAHRRHSLALDRVARLADANALLSDLHRVAQTLPASLDLGDVLDTTIVRLRSLLAHDTVVVLTTDPGGRWRVARQTAAGISGELTPDQLPAPVRRAIASNQAIRASFPVPDGRGFGPSTRAGIYLPLLARDRRIGLLAVESRDDDAFSDRQRQLLEGFVEPVALAIDNARWFQRIRTVGADEERNRIARDLHDRIGQSLAYLGFEVDRLIRRNRQGDDIGDNLEALRNDLRALVGEVRDTLSDLRTDVSDSRDFSQTAQEFIDRVATRSGLHIELECTSRRRLPILQEREMWRIAQEALVNVERHAQATTAVLRWCCDEQGALLEVTDDGRGLRCGADEGRIGRPDSYGIVGMRERADSVGATFEMTSQPGEGTKVRCFLARR